MVVSRVKKGGTSTYCEKGEVMVDSPEQLILLWEYGSTNDSRNREMMVASYEQLTVAKVGLHDLTAH